MADIFLRSSDGNNANAGTDKSAPKATLANAMTAAGAGGRVYVSASHSETLNAATMTLAGGTAASPMSIFCVPDWGAESGTDAPTSLSTGATVTTTGNAPIVFTGFAFCYGIVFSSSSSNVDNLNGWVSGSPWWWRLEECSYRTASTNSGYRFHVGNSGVAPDDMLLELVNTTLQFNNAGHALRIQAPMVWQGGSVTGATLPTTLISIAGNIIALYPTLRASNLDLSNLGSGKNLVGVSAAMPGFFQFRNCKLGSSVSITTNTIPGPGGAVVEVINCDSSDTAYRYYRQTHQATEQHETTVVRTGGASDGSTTVSRKIVTTSASSLLNPYRSQPIEFWNTSTGASLTITIPVLTDNVTLTDAEAWLEVEHLGTSGFPFGSLVSGRVAYISLGTPANQPTDSGSTWTTTGLTTPVKQSLSVSVTPQEVGMLIARVCVAKASTTVYYDPKVLSTSGRQYQAATAYLNEGPRGVSRARVVNA